MINIAIMNQVTCSSMMCTYTYSNPVTEYTWTYEALNIN